MLVVKNVTNNIMDVFWKEGWDNCVRVRRDKIGSLSIVKAYCQPPKSLMSELKEIIK